MKEFHTVETREGSDRVECCVYEELGPAMGLDVVVHGGIASSFLHKGC